MLLKKEKESRVKFNPGLSANRPSNNWAQKFTYLCTPVYQYCVYTVCDISPDKGLCDFVGADL